MKAEASEAPDAGKSGENTAVATPDTASQAGVESEGEGGEGSAEESDAGVNAPAHSATSSSSTAVAPASAKGKGKAPSEDTAKKASEQPESAGDPKKGKNLVGRINNLVTSDLSSLEPIGMFLTFCSAYSSDMLLVHDADDVGMFP